MQSFVHKDQKFENVPKRSFLGSGYAMFSAACEKSIAENKIKCAASSNINKLMQGERRVTAKRILCPREKALKISDKISELYCTFAQLPALQYVQS